MDTLENVRKLVSHVASELEMTSMEQWSNNWHHWSSDSQPNVVEMPVMPVIHKGIINYTRVANYNSCKVIIKRDFLVSLGITKQLQLPSLNFTD